MKPLLLVSPLIFLSCCASSNYSSLVEARTNCQRWVNKGFEFHWKTDKNEKRSLPNRACKYAEETSQFLGYEYKKVKKRKVYSSICDVPKKFVVEKRFSF